MVGIKVKQRHDRSELQGRMGLSTTLRMRVLRTAKRVLQGRLGCIVLILNLRSTAEQCLNTTDVTAMSRTGVLGAGLPEDDG